MRVRNVIDLFNPKQRFTASASYYKEAFDGPEFGAQQFNYEYVNTLSNTYRRLFANVQGVAGEVAIRTNDQLEFKANGIVVTQDGKTFKIIQVEIDYQAANKQAFRVLGTPISTEYVLRLVKEDDPWGIQ